LIVANSASELIVANPAPDNVRIIASRENDCRLASSNLIGAIKSAIPLTTDGHGARYQGINGDGTGELEVNVVTESRADQDGV
jgi:hypothetical protein